jgi:integral membrane sensor domain MASE1
MQSRRFSGLPLIGILAVIYFIAGKLGLMLASLQASASPVWPPAGIALAALLLLGYRAWPAIFVGAFLVLVMDRKSQACRPALCQRTSSVTSRH